MADPQVVRTIARVARRRHVPRRYVLAAYETGIVESGLRNLPGGDADSAGWRQERGSLYPNPRNVRASVKRFFREAQQLDRGQPAGQLAADVQRPRAEYRGRYGQVRGDAVDYMRRYLDSYHGGSGSGGGSIQTAIPGRWSVKLRNQQQFDAPAFKQARNAFVVGNLIAKHRGTDNPLFKAGLLSTTTPSPGDFSTNVLSSSLVKHAGRIVSRPGSGGGGGGTNTSLKGTALFEGTRVAAWIKPELVYARRHGWKGSVTSGYRSYADQKRIYNSGVRPAARPGTSNHEGSEFPRGAVDVSDAATLSRILRRKGSKLKFAGAKDPVHFSHPHGGSY